MTGDAATEPAPTYDPPLQHCVMCGSDRLQAFDRDHRGHTIARCRDCGVRFMNPQYTDAWLAHYYSTYVPASGHSRPSGWRARPEVRREGKLRALRWLGAHVDTGRILMVGCGDGLELQIARELGWQVTGHDVDPATTARVASELGVEVLSGAFDRLDLGSGSFDAVYLDQVIEHPKNPADFLRTAFRLLRPGGALYLGQPNIGSLSNRLKTLVGRLGLRRRRRGRHYASQHHITYYSPGVLARLLRARFGFEVLTVRGSPKPGRPGRLGWLPRRVPLLDSSFAIVARRPLVARRDGAVPSPADRPVARQPARGSA